MNEVEIYKTNDAQIEVRVNSKRGIQFRLWATQRMKDYVVILNLAA